MAKPEDLQHSDIPPSDREGAEQGRQLAAKILGKNLGARGDRQVPPPVKIQTKSTFGDDGEDGG